MAIRRQFSFPSTGAVRPPMKILMISSLLSLAACAGAPSAPSGFLSSYRGLDQPGEGLDAGVAMRSDTKAVEAMSEIYIQPAVVKLSAGSSLDADEWQRVAHEVDRQVCFHLSKHYTIVPAPAPGVPTLRIAVVRVAPTGQIASGVSAATRFFIPVPVVKVRLPVGNGGLGTETELMGGDGAQVVAMLWSKDAQVVGRLQPSLSRVGDALQLAQPFSDKVTKTISNGKPDLPVPNPDPCAAYGPRPTIGSRIAEGAEGAVTGLYMPPSSKPAAGTNDKAVQ